MKVLVTGGAGYIGTHTMVELLNAGHSVVAVDNFVNSCPEALARVKKITGKEFAFFEADVCDEAAMDAVFKAHPDTGAVIHFAGLKAVGESVEKPLLYYRNNIVATLSLLAAMERAGCRRFIFSSSATVYGDGTPPFTEGDPVSATNPYGQTKLMLERILQDYAAANPAFRLGILRYFNPIGAHESGLIGEDPRGVPNNLLPYVAQTAVGIRPWVRVYGDDYNTPDGTGVRDYIHVVDLARGHLAALNRLAGGESFLCNLGTGRGYSVLEVIAAYGRAVGRELPYRVQPRRPGDVDASWGDPSLAKQILGWQAEYDLGRMCADSWNWQRGNPNGYGDK